MPATAARTPHRCGLSYCQSGLPARLYPAGYLCDRCCPSAVAGEPHPDEIAAISRAQWADSVAASTTATRTEAA